MYFYLGIILLAVAGFSIALYIRKKKSRGHTLVCPVGTTCDAVIHSEYSRFFGIPVELLGMGYYALLALVYGALLIFPALAHPTVTFVLLALTTAAFLFSLYLTFIQAFALRQWCTWCLISASFCTLILFFVVAGSGYGFVPLLAEHHAIFIALHLFGTALGLGGATISDVMFFKFLKDLRISQLEERVLNALSQIIWFALGVMVISGLGLYLPQAETLNTSAKFLVKMIVVGVIIINGAFLNLLIAPNLVKISFGQAHKHMSGELHHIRKLAFAMGAVSLTSWYTAFLFGLLRSSPASFTVLLGIYIGAVFIAVVVSQLVERHLGSKRMQPPST